MKTLKLVTRVAVISLTAFAANAMAGNAPTLQEMQDCYKKHHQIMDKPSVKTLDACWRAHHASM